MYKLWHGKKFFSIYIETFVETKLLLCSGSMPTRPGETDSLVRWTEKTATKQNSICITLTRCKDRSGRYPDVRVQSGVWQVRASLTLRHYHLTDLFRQSLSYISSSEHGRCQQTKRRSHYCGTESLEAALPANPSKTNHLTLHLSISCRQVAHLLCIRWMLWRKTVPYYYDFFIIIRIFIYFKTFIIMSFLNSKLNISHIKT